MPAEQDKILEMLDNLAKNMVTRQDIRDVAEEIVEKKLADASTRQVVFDAGNKTMLADTKEKNFKTVFTPAEQKELDKIFLYKTILGEAATLTSPWVVSTLSGIHGFDVKAQDTTSLGNLIPTGLSPALEDEIQLRLLVASQFRTIDQPTNPYKIPVKTARSAAYHVAEQAAVTASSASVGQVTLDLEKLAVLSEFSYEVEADSLVPVLGMLRDDIVNVLARQLDDNVINGKATPATGQTAVYGTWDGLKWLANAYGSVASAAQASVFSTTDIMNMRDDMNIRGVRTDDLVLFVSTGSYNDLLQDASVITVDKLGSQATILRGQVASLWGVPIVLSEFVNTTSANMGNTSGLAANKDMVLASRSGFIVGRPGGPGRGPGLTGGVLVEQDRNITTQVNQLVASIRRDFQTMVPTNAATSANPPVSHRFHKV